MRAVGTHTLVFDAPALADGDLARKIDHGEDACELDDERFFVRGRLQVPVSDTDTPLEWHVWVGVRASDYVRLVVPESDGAPVRRGYAGWLANDLAPVYEGTLDLRVTIYADTFGGKPVVVVESHAHPLAMEQREGVTFQRLHEIQHALDLDHVRTCRHGHLH